CKLKRGEKPAIKDITYSDDEDDVGAEADFNNLETSITVSPIPTTRVHKDHLVTQIIGDLSSATQTKSMTRVARDQGVLSQINNDDFHTCMFACFLSQEVPKRVHQAFKDPSWIEAILEELLQFKMQKVWVLVDLPHRKRAFNVNDVPAADAEPTLSSPTPTTQPPPPSQELPSTSQVIPTPPPSPIAQPSSPPQQPQPTHDAKISMDLLQTLLETCTTLTRKEIIANIDADEDVTLKDVAAVAKEVEVGKDAEIEENVDVQGRQAESQVQIYKIDLEHADKVLSMQDDELEPDELKEVVEVVTTAKLMTEVVTAAATIIATTTPITAAPSAARRRKGVVIRDLEEIATPSIIIHTEPKSKDKGKWIMKTKEQMEEEDNRALKTTSESLEEKAAKKQKLDEEMILLVERRYPLTRFTLDQMLNNVRFKVEEESEMSLELLRFTPKIYTKGLRLLVEDLLLPIQVDAIERCCCSNHMTGNIELRINFVWKFLGTVRFGNDHITAILRYGDLKWGNITITRVYFVEDLDGVDLLKGNRSTNLYIINLYDMASASPICLMARTTPTKSWLWHQRLYHLNFDTINDLAKNDNVSGLPKFKYAKEHLCPSCEQGKSKRASHPVAPTPPPSPHKSPIAPPSSPPPQKPPSHDAAISMDLLNQLLETYATLTKKVGDLEQDKIA
nr:hypothetical protein [Tanacetum cinerariifolium]